jgi:hypothetical protein
VKADSATRSARIAAHDAFDPMWQRGAMSRREAYRWLSQSLGIPEHQCHMKQMDRETCERVVALCAPITLATMFEVLP